MKKHLLPSFGIIGGGAWRAQFYLRIARDLPGIFPFAGFVDRDPEKRTKISQKWGLPVYASIEELLDKGKPDFVVTTVPWSENLPVVKELSQSKVATLSETPVAPTMAELKQMSQLVTMLPHFRWFVQDVWARYMRPIFPSRMVIMASVSFVIIFR
jgi:predicted dehydrogenase